MITDLKKEKLQKRIFPIQSSNCILGPDKLHSNIQENVVRMQFDLSVHASNK